MAGGGPSGFDVFSFLKGVAGTPSDAAAQGGLKILTRQAASEADASSVDTRAPLSTAAAQGSSSSVDQRILDTAYSSAANAFAAATGSGSSGYGQAGGPRGRTLPMQERVVYDVTSTNPDEAQPELEVSPITMYNSEYSEQLRQQVAVNNNYICYSLRQGHVRVLNKVSAARALHKAHTGAVTELRFFSNTVSKIISCGLDAAVFVYEVKEVAESVEIVVEPIASFHLETEPKEGSTMTAAWHPVFQDLVTFTANESVYVCDIGGAAGGSFTITPISLPTNVVKLSATALVTNAAFSPSGNMLAVGTQNGVVSIWKTQSLTSASQMLPALSCTAPQAEFSPYPDPRSTRVYWIPVLSEVESEVLMTGGPVNRDLCLWSVDPTAACDPSFVQQFLLDAPQGDASFFNHIHLQPDLQLVIVANTKTKAVYTVQYSLQANQALPIRFSYAARFSVTMPILSLTATWNSPLAEGASDTIQLYCVQTQAVQQYTLRPEMCCPPAHPGTSAPPERLNSFALKHRADLRSLSRGGSDIDKAEFASSAGFATAGSACDPMDLPEPGTETASRVGEGYEEDDEDDEEEDDGGCPSLDVGDDSEPPLSESSGKALEDTAASGLPPKGPGLKLLTPTDLLASAHRLSAGSPNLSRSESLDAINPPPPTPATISTCGSNADILAANTGPLSHSAPTAAMINSRVSRLADSSKEPPPPAPPAASSDLSFEVLLQLKQLQGSVGSMQSSLAAQFDAKVGELEKRMEVQRENLKKEMHAQAQAQTEMIQSHLSASATNQKQMMEELLSVIAASMHRDLPQLLTATLKKETDSMVAQLSSSASSAIAASVGEQMKGSISAPVQAALEKALAEKLAPALKTPVQDGMHSCFTSTLLPGFQSAVHEMFTQLNTAVTAGLREHAETSSMQAVRAVTEQLGSTNAMLDSLRRDLEQYQTKVEDGLKGAGQQAPGHAPPATKALSLAEIEAKQDPTIRLQQLVSQGEYEEAFTMALSLSHVETVVWLCQLADLRSVLQKPCKLSQSVLLSLVQQLGSDLGNRGGGMQEKLDWIQDLALLLDTSDPVLAPHMGPILSQLLANLKAAEAVAPREDSSAFRIVTHIVKSLLTTCQ